MDIILNISMNIIIIWWALIVILWIIVLSILINILWKINYMISDIKQKYDLIIWTLIKPINTIIYFINKIKKNG